MRIKPLYILLFTLLPLCMHAQKDFGSWMDIGFTKEFNKHYRLSLEESIRLEDNLCRLSRLVTDIGVEYKYNKSFSFILHYRYSHTQRPNGYYGKHRSGIDIKYQYKIHRYEVSYRNRTTLENNRYINEISDTYPTTENRNRIKISYNIKGSKANPYIGTESFHQMQSDRFFRISDWRYLLGFTYNWKHQLRTDIGFLYQHKLNLQQDYILKIGVKKTI